MNKRSPAPARALAAIALCSGFVVVLVVVATSLGGGGGNGDSASRPAAGKTVQEGKRKKKPAPKSYVVQNGDTLTSIAHRTGVSVARIQALNPGVDPQILVSGEKLKLR